ncbi:MAG: hypothetical protein RBS43_02030 [Candidatus Cloacimonas sp.]|nr:hypothetical protein [Candidatus Cloacimonas sp.]
MKKILILLVLATGLASMFAVALQHVSPLTFTFNENVPLMVEIQQGLDSIAEIKLMYRSVGDTRWNIEIAKQESQGSVYYRVEIPARLLSSETIEYYFEVKLNHGTTENFPAAESGVPYYRINPAALEGEASPGFVLLTDGKSVSADDGYLLVVSFFALQGDIDPASIEVWVGGKNVTAKAIISAPTIMYKDANPQSGIKKAVIHAKLGTKDIHSDIWVTEILGGKKKLSIPFEYRGTVNFASNYYSYSKMDNAPGASDSDAATWTDFYGRYKKVDFQTNLYISSLEKKNLQPVNRYTLGVQIPHLDIYAGDYSPALSKYTLNGKNIRGLYGRLHSNSISLFLTSGQSIRKTTDETDISDEPGIQKSGTFQQEAIGARLQVGKEDGVMMGLNVSRHRDIISSLDSLYYRYDSQGYIYTTPAVDNAVLSFDICFNIPEQRSMFGAEVASSLLNKNTIPGPIDQATLEDYAGQDIPVNPEDFAGLFVINKNMEPFLLGRANMAWLMYLRTYFWNSFLNVQYAETGSAFNALGALYQMQDSKNISVTDQMNISRYFVLSGGFNYSEDNLMNLKSETNGYTTWNLQSILRLPKMPYLKMAYYSSGGENKANSEVEPATPFEPYIRNSQNLSFGMGYNVTQIRIAPTQFDISYRMGADDSNKTDTLEVSIPLSDNENSGLYFSMSNRFAQFPLITQFSLALNKQKQQLLDLNNDNQVIFLGASYGLWENRIKPYANYRTVSLGGDQGKQSYGYLTLGVEANPLKDMTISTDLGFQNHNDSSITNTDYSSFIWRLLLSQRF